MRFPAVPLMWTVAAAMPLVVLVRPDIRGHLRAKFRELGVAGVLSVIWRFGGVLLTWRQHSQLVAVVEQPRIRIMREAFPRLVFRYTLSYLSTSLMWGERRVALQDHYAFVNQVFDDSFSRRVLADALDIWTCEIEGERLSVSVQSLCPVTRHREGELTLCFKVEGTALYKLSFSIVSLKVLPCSARVHTAVGASHALFVGRVQGLTGAMGALRQATALMGEIAPQDLLMAAMSGLAAALSIDTLIGVSDADCVSRDSIARSESCFCYDQFWARYGSQVVEGGHHLMKLPVTERPIGEIASKHRKRTQRKRDFKRQVADSCEQAIRSVMN